MVSWITRGLRVGWRLLVATVEAWFVDHASLMAAALSFYSLISIAPLLIIVLYVSSFVLGPQQVQQGVASGVAVLLGDAAAQVLGSLIERAAVQGAGWMATAVGTAIVLYGSMRVFAELQRALRVVWRNPEETPSGFRLLQYLSTHLFSFLLVIGAGLLWLLGIVGSTALSAVARWLREKVPASAGLELATLIHGAASVLLLSAALALIYRLFSEGRATWRDVWPGAVLTAVLLTVGQKLIGYYLANQMARSVYGVAGSAIAVVFWFYYSWLIFFLGAEFTKVWATERQRIRQDCDPRDGGAVSAS